MVNRMLMRKSAPQPRSRKTPTGGRKIAKMILQMSEAVKGMLTDLLVVGGFGWVWCDVLEVEALRSDVKQE